MGKKFDKLQKLNKKYYKWGIPYFYMHEYKRGFWQMQKLFKVPISETELQELFEHYQYKHGKQESNNASNITSSINTSAILSESGINEESSFLSPSQTSEFGKIVINSEPNENEADISEFTQSKSENESESFNAYYEELGSVSFSMYNSMVKISDYI